MARPAAWRPPPPACFVRYTSSSVDEKLKRIIESSNLGAKEPEKRPEPQKIGSDASAARASATSANGSSASGSSATESSAGGSSETLERIRQDITAKIGDLPSQRQKLQSDFTKAFESRMDSLQTTILKAMRLLNDVTGYSAIETLKHNIEALEKQLADSKSNVKAAKKAYSDAIQERSESQKEINELLTRKHNWTSSDLERFTELYRNDHANEQKEVRAQEDLDKVEQLVDATQLELTQSILTRYHEEQIWSDKIRRASTWGTMVLMGINLMLFGLATLLVEPWKRRRMVDAFEEKVKVAMREMSSEQSGKLDDLMKQSVPAVDHDVAYLQIVPHNSSWSDLYTSLHETYRAVNSPEFLRFQVSKLDLQILFGIFTVSGAACGALLTYYWT